MVFYFILGLSVAALILDGKCRAVILTFVMIFDMLNLHLGFRFPNLAYPLTYEERWMDTLASFLIVSVFIIAVIIIMAAEYGREHDKVVCHAEKLNQQAITDNLTKLYNRLYLMDLDDFKKVNDTYGHLRGDQVLCRFADILRKKTGINISPPGTAARSLCWYSQAVRVKPRYNLPK